MLETIKKSVSKNFDSCIVEVPREFALANGFPEKCFVIMTMQNGKLASEVIEHNDQDESGVEEFFNNFPTLNEEMKKVGD